MIMKNLPGKLNCDVQYLFSVVFFAKFRLLTFTALKKVFLTDKHIIIIGFWLIRSAFSCLMFINYTLHGVKFGKLVSKLTLYFAGKLKEILISCVVVL